MDPVFAIVNPASDNGRTEGFWFRERWAFDQAGVELEEAFTEGPGHATVLAQGAAVRGYRTILSVGGDGTMNEVANGLLGLPRGERPALALLARGTGADLPRGLGLRPGATEAAARLRRRRLRRLDVVSSSFTGPDGDRVSRYFVNIADAGLGGGVAERVNGRSKAFGGFASFLAAIVAGFWAYEKPELTVTVDGVQRHRGRTTSVILANGLFFAGGMRIAPQASPSDGVLDVVVIQDVTRTDLVLNLPRLYRGTHLSHPRIANFRGTEVVIEGEAPLELDGEHPGWSPMSARLEPSALDVLT